ncbi:MAG: hypothetical protein CHACPFDD_01401 [Phycisphaerae bacterium]|nr:hypothetical protein [Phycisphaerae bacterium]
MTSAMHWLLAEVWIPFVNPIPVRPGVRLLMLLPLALCVAVVYRAIRARTLRGLPWYALLTFLNIVGGMALLAIGFYVLHEFVLHFWT